MSYGIYIYDRPGERVRHWLADVVASDRLEHYCFATDPRKAMRFAKLNDALRMRDAMVRQGYQPHIEAGGRREAWG